MWPKRKIQLVVSASAPGIDGVRAVLKEFQLNFCETVDLNSELNAKWWEKSFETVAEEPAPVTDVVFWSEETESNTWREKAISEGLNLQSIQSFIHNILDDQVILQVAEPTVMIKGRPLLGHILLEAEFEPSILWPLTDGEWLCERRQGLYWIIPETWQLNPDQARSTGSESQTTDFGPRISDFEPGTATWVVRDNRLDFYQAQNCLTYVGQLPRWPEPVQEQTAAETIALCIDLGVSWLDIRLALSSIWPNINTKDNLRWDINDTGWNARTGGEELSAVQIDHLADRRAGGDGLLAADKEGTGRSLAACQGSQSTDLADRAGFESLAT